MADLAGFPAVLDVDPYSYAKGRTAMPLELARVGAATSGLRCVPALVPRRCAIRFAWR